MYIVFMALVTALVLCAWSQDLLLSLSVCRTYVVFSTAGFEDGGKPCHRTLETVALRRAQRGGRGMLHKYALCQNIDTIQRFWDFISNLGTLKLQAVHNGIVFARQM